MREMAIGTKGSQSLVVEGAHTARAMGSGELEVLATPAVAALVEKAAWTSVAPMLDPGETTVGTRIELDHVAPTPVGGHASCETELVEADGRRLVFAFVVTDDAGKVAEGTHERFVVAAGRFQTKADGRLQR